MFNHLGYGNSVPQPCTCPNSRNTSSACNTLRLVAGLLFYNIPAQTSVTALLRAQVGSLLTLLSKYGTYRALNAAAYNATATSVLVQGYQQGIFTPAWQRGIFKFCKLANNQTCSAASFFVFNPNTVTVSPYHYNLVNGSCSNSMSIRDEVWEQLATRPPVPLTQSYYECYNTFDAALLNAAGVASGNASIAMLVLMIALLPLIYTLLAIFQQVPQPSEYSERQKSIPSRRHCCARGITV